MSQMLRDQIRLEGEYEANLARGIEEARETATKARDRAVKAYQDNVAEVKRLT